jgi:hypothetical protein
MPSWSVAIAHFCSNMDSVGKVQKAFEPTQKRVILIIINSSDANIASAFQFVVFRQQSQICTMPF